MARKQPGDEEIAHWHRWFGSQNNNRGWALAEQLLLDEVQQRELLFVAYAGAHHWSNVGTAVHVARAELLLTRAHALNGHGDLAMHYARRAFDFITTHESEAWELAFAHAGIAEAAAVQGEVSAHRNFYASAKALGDALTDEGDRAVFFASFDRLPVPRA